MLPSHLEKRVIAEGQNCSVFVDTSKFPLVIHRLVGKPEIQATKAYYARMNALLQHAKETSQKLVIINDFSESTPADAIVRRAFVEGAEALAEKYRANLICWIPIMNSAIIRGVMTAISWIISDKSAVPIQYANSFKDAISKSLQLFEHENVTLPDINPDSYTFPR